MFASSAGSAALVALRRGGSLAPRFARIGGAHATTFGRFLPYIAVDKEGGGARTNYSCALPLAGAIAVAFGVESSKARTYCQPPNVPVQINGSGSDDDEPSGDVVAEASITMPSLPPLGDTATGVGTGGATRAAAAAAASASDASSDTASSATFSVGGASDADAQLSASKKRYYELLSEREKKKKGGNETKYLTAEAYDYATSIVTNWQPLVKHDKKDYQIKNKFYVGEGVAGSSLREKKSGLKVANRKELFDTIYAAHKQLSHSKTARTVRTLLAKEWYGITEEAVQLCIDVCPGCVAKKAKITAKQPPLKMIISPTIGFRAQMDLIDMTSQPTDDGYKWILRYHDHLSGFGHVAALKNKSAVETGDKLMQILGTAPLPNILQSDNGGEFLGHCKNLVNKYYPKTHVVKSRPRHPQTNGGVERGNGPFKTALQIWMQQNNTSDWATHGIYVVNQQINLRPKRNKDGASSYELYYGQVPTICPYNILDSNLCKLAQTELGIDRAMKLIAEKGNPSPEEIRAAIAAGDEAFFAEESELSVATSTATGSASTSTDVPAASNSNSPATGSTSHGAASQSPEGSMDRVVEALSSPESSHRSPTGGEREASSQSNEAPVLCLPANPANADVNRKRNASQADLDTHPADSSPRRASLRARAVRAQTRQANQVNARRAAFSKAVLDVGDICNLKIEGNVLGATDMRNVPVAVTQVKASRTADQPPTYQIASQKGYLKGYFQRQRLDHIPSVTMEIMGIDLTDPRMEHDLTDAQASALFNVSGGGAVCGCTAKDCATNPRCTCNKKRKFCTTKCHGGRGNNPHCTFCPPSNP